MQVIGNDTRTDLGTTRLQRSFEMYVRTLVGRTRPDLAHLTWEADWREPVDNVRFLEDKGDIIHKWHQDGNEGRRDFWLVLWSNRYPTCVRRIGETDKLEVRDGDIILFQNDLCEHRTRSITPQQARGRWFMRVNVGQYEAQVRYHKRPHDFFEKPLDIACGLLYSGVCKAVASESGRASEAEAPTTG